MQAYTRKPTASCQQIAKIHPRRAPLRHTRGRTCTPLRRSYPIPARLLCQTFATYPSLSKEPFISVRFFRSTCPPHSGQYVACLPYLTPVLCSSKNTHWYCPPAHQSSPHSWCFFSHGHCSTAIGVPPWDLGSLLPVL